jgi:colicin import membrane protein
MSEEKKESKVESKPSEDSQLKQSSTDSKIIDTVSGASSEAEIAARAAEDAETAVREAMAKAKIAKEKAEVAAEVEYKAIAAQVKADTAKAPDYTFKRKGEQIFRREMGEPEFFLDKKDRFPRPILTADEQESLTRKAEKPRDQTPAYVPEHVLSPEFEGISNYEQGVSSFLEEIKQKLEKLKNSSDSSAKEIRNTENEIKYLESIHENFYIGMNVFRTAKGGRDKIKA